MSKQNSKSTILITGASGLLGSHVVKQVLKTNISKDFSILVRNDHQAQIWSSLGITSIIGDLEEPNFNLPNTINTIVHIAAIAGDWVDKTKVQIVNVEGTIHLIKQAAKIGCKKFIYVSTIYKNFSFQRLV